MKRYTFSTLIFIFVLVSTAMPEDLAAKRNQGKIMADPIHDAQEELKKYDESKDLAHLEEAADKLDEIDLFKPSGTGRTQLRLRNLEIYCSIIARIDEARDPNFDPKDLPVTRVTPPQIPGQPTYLPGVDPKEIKDPNIRAEYEKAIEKNNQKVQYSKRQFQVIALNSDVTERVVAFIRKFYTSALADQQELKAVMEKAGLTLERQNQLVNPN